MDSVVPGEDRADGEAFPTLVARIGPLPRVGPFMRYQGGFEAEAFPTVLAHEGLLSRVGPLMSSQHCAPTEGFPTHPTSLLPAASSPSLDNYRLGLVPIFS